MASEFPLQTRTVDPYASYNSNVVNQLTRMITRGKNCLHGVHAIDVEIDSTSSISSIVVLPGECFKDDIILQILEPTHVDLRDQNFYINHMNPLDMEGYYYICLEYIYVKARPAPQAKIRILKSDQIHLYDADNSAFILLKVVNIVFNTILNAFVIEGLYDYDPSIPTNKREYTQIYAGADNTLPLFDKNRDEGRLVYIHDRNEMFFGLENRWESFNAVRANIDTSMCDEGSVSYLAPDNKVYPAIATSDETLSNCAVLIKADGLAGKVRLFGEFENVLVESGIVITAGDKLFLSDIEAGAVTNLSTLGYNQCLGIATTPSFMNRCNMWFMPNIGGGSSGGSSVFDFYTDLLDGSVFEYLFIEPFYNSFYIDSTSSDVMIDVSSNSINNLYGTTYQSNIVQDPTFDTLMEMAQISSQFSCDSTSNIKWYLSNNSGDDWESTELDTVHYFSTYRIEYSTLVGLFDIGENIMSSITNKMATINGLDGDVVLVFGDTNKGIDYQIGEVLTGMTGGATCVITDVVDRQQVSYHDLKLKLEMIGSPGGCVVSSIGVLYDIDEDLFNHVDVDLQKNIDTLYLDLYTYPTQDNDGMPNLAIPIETQLHDLATFVDTTCCARLSQVEYDIWNIIHNPVPPLNDNDVDTLYSDIYTSPHRDDDGNANLTIPLETQIANLTAQMNNISLMIISTADTHPDVVDLPTAIRVDYAGSLTITDFDNGIPAQKLTIIFTNDITIVRYSPTIYLAGEIDFIANTNSVLNLVHDGSKWVEKSRSIAIFS